MKRNLVFGLLLALVCLCADGSRIRAAAAYDSSWKVYSANGTIPEEGLLAVIDQAVKESKLTREVIIGEVADVNLLREVQKELAIKV
ncbi:MAG TPA: hypothetical protein VNT76_13875 [Candidatus Binatus sp.]|nr:hypothetical protein [Candidatus Binatus sp.]